MQRNIVIYHDNCADGLWSGWVASTALRDQPDQETIYIALEYDQELHPSFRGLFPANLYILDFSFPAAQLVEMAELSQQTVLLDHHPRRRITGSDDLTVPLPVHPKLQLVLDPSRCGCLLAWEHFHPGQPPPWVLSYVDDRDRWVWRRTNSRQVNAGLELLPGGPGAWKLMDAMASEQGPTPTLIERGLAVLAHKTILAQKIAAQAIPVTIAGYRVRAANTPILRSEVCELLIDETPFGVVWSIREDGRCRWSLRARSTPSGIDVGALAARYGGSGHAGAAGFTTDTFTRELP